MGRELVLRSASNRVSIIFLGGWRAQRFLSVVRGSSNGAVAQLGERLICIQEVAGSIPTSSTSFEPGACSSVG